MFEIGRVCMKIAGRDAGKKCVVVDNSENLVLIDGETRRRKVNRSHIEPTGEIVKIAKGANSAEVCKALGVAAKVAKPRKASERPVKQRKEPSKKEGKKETKAK